MIKRLAVGLSMLLKYLLIKSDIPAITTTNPSIFRYLGLFLKSIIPNNMGIRTDSAEISAKSLINLLSILTKFHSLGNRVDRRKNHLI